MAAEQNENAAGAAYWLGELAILTEQGLHAIREARKYGASPDRVIEAIASGADQDASAIPMMARMAMRRAIESV